MRTRKGKVWYKVAHATWASVRKASDRSLWITVRNLICNKVMNAYELAGTEQAREDLFRLGSR